MANDRKLGIVSIDEIRWYNVGAWFAVMQARGLAELGHRAVFIAKTGLPPGIEARKMGLHVHDDFSFGAVKFIDEARKLARIAKELQAEVICAHRAGGMNLAIAARSLLPHPKPIIVRARYDARPVKSGLAAKYQYRNIIHGVMVPNKQCASMHINNLNMPEDRVRVVHGGVDVDLFRPDKSARAVREELRIPLDSPLIGLVARLDIVKGHNHFLQAAALISNDFPEARFAVIGKEINIKTEDLKILSKRLGIEKNVIFIGERPDVNRIVAALDVGVVSSVGSEALSRVLLEYMACGIPAVATKVGGIPDVLEDEKAGYLVAPENTAEMANAVKKILGDRDAAAAMGREGRRLAESIYSIKSVANKSLEFFQYLIEQNIHR